MAPFCKQLKMLLFRGRALFTREPAAAAGRFGATIFMSILLICVYYKSNTEGVSSEVRKIPIPHPDIDMSQVQNYIGAMFLCIMFQFFVTTFSNVLVF